MPETAVSHSNNPFDIFIVGLKKGLNIGLYSLLPNVLMAFVLTYILKLFGVLDFLGATCGGVMGVFGLPGEAITVLLATWLSCGAGVGVAASLASGNILGPTDGSPARRGKRPQALLARTDAQQRPHGMYRHACHALFHLKTVIRLLSA